MFFLNRLLHSHQLVRRQVFERFAGLAYQNAVSIRQRSMSTGVTAGGASGSTSIPPRSVGTEDGDRSAVVLLSGGLDSATVLAMALSDGYKVTTLSFDYGQRHRHEIEAASTLSSKLGVADHRLAVIDSSIFLNPTATSLTRHSSLSIPKYRDMKALGDDIPSTYVPARNTIFLSYALALAESIEADDIFIGANAVDYSGYPDCRPEYFRAFQRVADLGTKVGVNSHTNNDSITIRVPLLHLSKIDIIRQGLDLGLDYSLTHSCYDPGEDGRPCTTCDACILRADAFAQLGYTVDPVVERYQRREDLQKHAFHTNSKTNLTNTAPTSAATTSPSSLPSK